MSRYALVEEEESAGLTDGKATKRRSRGVVSSLGAVLPFQKNGSPDVVPKLGFCHETRTTCGASKGKKGGGIHRGGGRGGHGRGVRELVFWGGRGVDKAISRKLEGS